MATAGPLLFGSTNASVIANLALTSAPVGTELGGGLTVSGTPDYDSVLGYDPQGGSLAFTLPSDLAAFEAEGQISFEVDKNWLCKADPTNGSTATALGGSQYAVGMRESAGVEVFNCKKNSGSGPAEGNVIINYTTTQNMGSVNQRMMYDPSETPPITISAALHTEAHDDYVRMTYSWVKSGSTRTVTIAIDNVPFWREAMSDSSFGDLTSGTAQFVVGARYNGTSSMNGQRIRNLIIASDSVDWSQTGDVGKLAFWGDSTVGAPGFGPEVYDGTLAFAVLRDLAKQGIYFDTSADIAYQRYPGRYISDALSAPNRLSDTIPTLLATNPKTVIITAGTNDAVHASFNAGNFLTDLTTQLDLISDHSTVEKILVIPPRAFWGNTGLDTSTTRDNRDSDIIPPMLAYSGSAITRSVNAFSVLGGETQTVGYYIGWLSGGSPSPLNNLHEGPSGAFIEGAAVISALLSGGSQVIPANTSFTIPSSGVKTDVTETVGNPTTGAPDVSIWLGANIDLETRSSIVAAIETITNYIKAEWSDIAATGGVMAFQCELGQSYPDVVINQAQDADTVRIEVGDTVYTSKNTNHLIGGVEMLTQVFMQQSVGN